MLLWICIIVLATLSWAYDDVVTAPNMVPQALVAKQIAPGTSRVFSLGLVYSACDSCNVPGRTGYRSEGGLLVKDDDISGSSFRFDMSLFSLTWPKTKNIEGAVDWRGHPFGGGIFLNAHYALYLEAGVSPMIVQWLGPVYLGAAYEFTFGRYYGHDEKDGLETSINENYYTGSLNVCGGTMVFMNNHGIGIGAHGGMRQMRIINVGRLVNDHYNSRSGKYEGTKFQDGYHIEDWLFYYSFDFAGYTNLPLLKESNSKGHAGYVMSMELGLHTDNTPLVYGAFSFSLFL